MRSGDSFSPFGEFFFIALAQSHRERLAQAVAKVDRAFDSEGDLADEAAGLAAQFAIAPLIVDVEKASRSERAEAATAERFDIYSGRNAGDSYTRQIVTIHVPFKGDPDLFRCQASTRTVCSRPVWLVDTEVCFDIPVPTHGPADIKGEVQRMLSCLKQNATSLAQEIAVFNQSLLASAKSLLNQKKAEACERARVLDTLGLPCKKADIASATAPPQKGRTAAPAAGPHLGIDIFTHVFRVAFSFPGEARHRIGPIARNVQDALGPDSVFYDEWYKAELARPNLDLRLQGIYTSAELVVTCLCAGYERKEWCGLEWRAIRDLIKKRQDRIMLLRLDDADVAGSFSIDGYIDLRKHDDTETAALVVQRVTGTRPQIAQRRAAVVSGLPVEADLPADTPKNCTSSEDLIIEINEAGHGFAIRMSNNGVDSVDDCRILLNRLDRYLPQKRAFTKNPFEPMTVLRTGKVEGGSTSHGFVFATWDTDYRSTRFQADIPEQRSGARPELTGAGTWIVEFTLYLGGTALSTKTIFITLAAGSKPALVPDPRLEGPKDEPPADRFAHLKGAHVHLTPIIPIARAQDKFYVRNVTSEAIELEKSSGHVITIPARRITDDLPLSDDAEVTRLLELNGRLQWLSLSRSWRFFPEKPQSADERQCGFPRGATPDDPIIAQLQQRGQNTRFARLDNLPRYLLQGYQLVYDEAGLCLRHGDLILIAAGV